ncbi:tetratricopeptide repeat protein [Vibrio maerlii]|uniref:tetratricopeptide repeat protein n=1 Tax=Vibrio maerlii TaxID=2231648 RepID=UPI000E3E4FF6|nr:SEL1-like repeat protein [Vibrio maerlii]
MNTFKHITLSVLLASVPSLAAQRSATEWYQQGIEAKYRIKDAVAIESFEQAANLGHTESQYELAMLLLNQELIQGKSHDESISWLTQAAKNNHSKAQYELAMFYMDEYENPNSEQLVNKWMTEAASNNHQDAVAWVAKTKPSN